ncbi:hypothetical protein LZ199_26260 [Myxococcus sp. QH3KD-4-1]|nr:hypothetical protein [Myxococcus qinghaiensis]
MRHEPQPRHDFAIGVGATSDGQALYTASVHGSTGSAPHAMGNQSSFEVKRYSASGVRQWTRSYPLVPAPETEPESDVWGRAAMSVSPTGKLYLLTEVFRGSVTLGGGDALSGLHLSKLNQDGGTEWSLPLATLAEAGVAVVASQTEGAFVSVRASHPYSEELRCAPMEGALYRISSGGTVVWRRRISEPQCGNFRAEAVSLSALPDGGVALGGSYFGTIQTPKGTFSTQVESPFLAKFSADGQMTWFNAFPSSHGRVTSVGASSKGTLVAAGVLETGGLQWGTETLKPEARSFLLTAEATGTPRWLRSLGRSEKVVVAVEPAGRVVVTGLSRDYPHPSSGHTDPAQNPQLFARRFNLEGRELWNRFFLRSGGPSDLFSEQVACAAPSGEGNGNTLLFGHFSHTEDFGTGTLVPEATDTFLLKLGPGSEF